MVTSVLMLFLTLCIALVGVAIWVATIAKKNKKTAIPTKQELLQDNASYRQKKPRVYLQIEIDKINKGRIIIELFDDRVPDTAENFRNLCKGFDIPGSPGQVLHYKGSKFHLINKLAAQGGDFTSGDGTGGEYAALTGDRFVKVTDANLGEHAEPYLVSMVNHGEELTIGSQFVITFSSLPHLDGKQVVFGKVVEGFEVLSQMEDVLTTLGKPNVPVVIAECGEIEQETDAGNGRRLLLGNSLSVIPAVN